MSNSQKDKKETRRNAARLLGLTLALALISAHRAISPAAQDSDEMETMIMYHVHRGGNQEVEQQITDVCNQIADIGMTNFGPTFYTTREEATGGHLDPTQAESKTAIQTLRHYSRQLNRLRTTNLRLALRAGCDPESQRLHRLVDRAALRVADHAANAKRHATLVGELGLTIDEHQARGSGRISANNSQVLLNEMRCVFEQVIATVRSIAILESSPHTMRIGPTGAQDTRRAEAEIQQETITVRDLQLGNVRKLVDLVRAQQTTYRLNALNVGADADPAWYGSGSNIIWSYKLGFDPNHVYRS